MSGRPELSWLPSAFGVVLVTTAIGLLKRVHEARGRRWTLRQGVALVVIGGMLCSIIPPAPAFGAAQPSAPQITEPLKESYRQLGLTMAGTGQTSDGLEKLLQVLEKTEREIPRDTFDAEAIVRKVGSDPTKLYEWVRDETFLVPYRGVLRGPTGVLMDRLGNSLDRALLLGALLRSSGSEVRLAQATLSNELAKEVLDRARAIPEGGSAAAQLSSRKARDTFLEKYAEQFQLDKATIRKALEKVRAEERRVAGQVVQRVAEQSQAITAAVGKSRQGGSQADPSARLDAIRDHWWVQRRDGARWIDLDPTLPDGTPGKALASSQRTTTPEKLPRALYHEVSVRVVVEQWRQGLLKQQVALDSSLRPAEVLGKRVALRHVPTKWPTDLDLFQEKEPIRRLRATALAQDEWAPVLSVGDTNLNEWSFTASGDVKRTSTPPVLGESAQKVGGRIGGLLGGGGRGGGVPGRPAVDATHLSAEWLEYEIRSPGQPVQKTRREIFDLVGPDARAAGGSVPAPAMTEAQRLQRALTLLGESEVLLLAHQLSPDFVHHLGVKSALANQRISRAMLRMATSMDSKGMSDQASRIAPAPGLLHSLAVARRDWNRFSGDVYLDRPNVLSHHQHLRSSGESAMEIHEAIDIVANDVAVRPGSGTDPFVVRLEQGILDTDAEAMLAASTCHATTGCGPVENTSELFLASKAQGITWLTLRSTDEAAWQSVGLPKDVLARLKEDVKSGYAVIAPTKPIMIANHPTVGWWRVNLRTGHILGIGETGWGAATEVEAMLATVVKWITVSVVVAICLARVPPESSLTPGYLCRTGVCMLAAGFTAVGLLVADVMAAAAIGLVGGITRATLPSCPT